MEFIGYIIDFIMHIDKHMAEIIRDYGTGTYLILFLIIFCETGLVVTPFLPGDSLLFVLGALGASGSLNFILVTLSLFVAAVLGNTVNYFIGKLIGHKLIAEDAHPIIKKLVKREYIDKARVFYEKHGGKAIFLSRFLPILRTFAPFVAGIGNMGFARFSMYNLAGGLSWVLAFMFAGYFFGNIPTVQENFTYVIFGIIAVSLIPAFVAWINTKREKSSTGTEAQ